MSFFPLFAERGTMMEVVCSLKRSRASTLEDCIICQEAQKADKLYNATKQGLQTLLEAAQSRSKLRDPQNRDAVERVLQSHKKHRAPSASKADAGPSRASSTL